jgi:hypothetical protein
MSFRYMIKIQEQNMFRVTGLNEVTFCSIDSLFDKITATHVSADLLSLSCSLQTCCIIKQSIKTCLDFELKDR